MFTVATDPQFTHTVTVLVPVDGGHDAQTMQVTYRVQPADKEGPDTSTAEGSTEFLRAAVVTIGHLVDDAKQPVPWNDALRDRLFAVPYVRAALAKGYYAAINKGVLGN
ncbi:hypothetical protein [Sphingomonas sp.]|uniref:hypothetical protein n=1 Tax=Sphingomonas sp. TaxID=28214 RepID=UPI003CC61E57